MLKRAAIAAPLMALAITLSSTAYAAEEGKSKPDFKVELTASQKETLKEIRALRHAGNHEEAKRLGEEAGLHAQKREMKEMRKLSEESKAKLDAALAAKDYAAFKELTKGVPFGAELTEVQFITLAQAHALREAGDHEGARKLMRDAGFPKPHGKRGFMKTDKHQ